MDKEWSSTAKATASEESSSTAGLAIELLKSACQRNEWVSQYIGFDKEGKRDWSVGTNRKVREVRDRLIKGANNDKILIISISPLVLAWRATYVGGDKDVSTNSNDGDSGNAGSQEIEGKQQQDVVSAGDTIDTIDTIDNDKSGTAVNDAATDKVVGTDLGRQTCHLRQLPKPRMRRKT